MKMYMMIIYIQIIFLNIDSNKEKFECSSTDNFYYILTFLGQIYLNSLQ